MDSEQARLVQLAAAFLAAVLRDDAEATTLLQPDFEAEPRAPEALLYLAVAAAGTWCLATGRPDTAVSELWPQLPPPMEEQAGIVDRDGVAALATAVRGGSSADRAAAGARMSDAGVFLISAYDLAVATLEELERATAIPAAEWCTKFAEGASLGIGVD
jgi:hypothetical protein